MKQNPKNENILEDIRKKTTCLADYIENQRFTLRPFQDSAYLYWKEHTINSSQFEGATVWCMEDSDRCGLVPK